MNAALEFVDAGAGVSIQDAGRFGQRANGVPLAGAADPVLLACANALLARAADDAALEVALVGPTLRAAGAPVRVALAGDFAARLTPADGNARAVGSWRALVLLPGDTLAVGPCRSGIGYLAVDGGIAVPPVLGSRSSYARARLGGLDGRVLRAGDRLPCAPAGGAAQAPLRRSPRPFAHPAGPIRVLPGPQDDAFDADAWAVFSASGWQVTREADRMGLRLQGPPLRHALGHGADIVSEAIVPGAIQVPASGQPIVLGVDAQTIGGYAKIATVIAADRPRLAHARPGTVLRFAVVTRAEAIAARVAQADAWAQWTRQLVPVHADGEPDEALLHSANLISGMIDAGDDAIDLPVPKP